MRKLVLLAVAVAVVVAVAVFVAPSTVVHACSISGGKMNPCHA